jgi:hypothetical protein
MPRLTAVPAMNEANLTGGCLCGAVRYEARGTSRKIVNCHCSMCRRHSGAAFLTYAAYPTDSFHFTKGRPGEYRSSPDVVRTHCTVCGSPLTYVSDTDPHTVWLTVGSFDDPNVVQPTENWYVADKLHWLRIDDALPKCPGAPDRD